MARSTTKIPISDIILDEEIYPREKIDQKRVGIFAENIRDDFKFEPIEAEPHLLTINDLKAVHGKYYPSEQMEKQA